MFSLHESVHIIYIGQNKVADAMSRSYSKWLAIMWVLGREPESSVTITSALNSWVTSLAALLFQLYFYMFIIKSYYTLSLFVVFNLYLFIYFPSNFFLVKYAWIHRLKNRNTTVWVHFCSLHVYGIRVEHILFNKHLRNSSLSEANSLTGRRISLFDQQQVTDPLTSLPWTGNIIKKWKLGL